MTRFLSIIVTLVIGFVTIGRTQIFNGPIYRLHNTKLRILENINYLQQQGTTLQSAITTQRIAIAQLTTDVASLILSNQGIVAQLASLTSLLQPKCPDFTVEIDSKCYYLETNRAIVSQAMASCAALNGRLAEPGPDAAGISTFAEGLFTFYESEITTLSDAGKNVYWIAGAEDAVDGNFVYPVSGGSISSTTDASLFRDPPTSTVTEHLGIFLSDPSRPLLHADNNPTTDNRPYICEIDKS